MAIEYRKTKAMRLSDGFLLWVRKNPMFDGEGKRRSLLILDGEIGGIIKALRRARKRARKVNVDGDNQR